MTSTLDLESYIAKGKSLGIPEKEIIDWYCNYPKKFHCIFDGAHGTEEEFTEELPVPGHKILICPKCQGYKGIVPCIPGYCQFGEEEE